LINYAYSGLSDCYTRTGDHETAAKNYLQALEYKPDNPGIMLNMSHNLIVLGRYEQAKI